MDQYIPVIEEIWNKFNQDFQYYKEKYLPLLKSIIEKLDNGSLRICYKEKNTWKTNNWLKKAIVLYIKFSPNKIYDDSCFCWYDKIDQKFSQFTSSDYDKQKLRLIPGAIVRKGAFIEENVIIMPSFINIGAHIGSFSLIDTWASIGSCAHIGKSCHIAAGSGIGGVLEPIQNSPVIIEDNCFIGARSEIVEGVIIGEGSVIAMGVFISASTKIIYRDSGKVLYGYIPPYSVVVPGSTSNPHNQYSPSLYCAVIVKTVDSQTRKKTQINDLLRY